MLYHLRWTADKYPFSTYFNKQIVAKEYGASGDNPHYHAIVQIEDTTQAYQTAKKHLQRHTIHPKQYSFKVVKTFQGLHKYISKETIPFITTLDPPEVPEPKITHKKGETFIQYILQTYKPLPYGDAPHDYQQQHVLNCFLEKEQEISKTKYRNALTTLRFHHSPDRKDGKYTTKDIPTSWSQTEQ